jgi:hypothetical protein
MKQGYILLDTDRHPELPYNIFGSEFTISAMFLNVHQLKYFAMDVCSRNAAPLSFNKKVYIFS